MSQKWISLALRTDGELGPGHLVDMFEGCNRYFDFVDQSWSSAREAVSDALDSALWSDLIDPDPNAWLFGPWATARWLRSRERRRSTITEQSRFAWHA